MRRRQSPQNRFEIKGFGGGADFSGADGRAGDGRPDDVLNMWWSGGALKTRPGIRAVADSFYNLQGRELALTAGGGADIPSADGALRRIARVYKRDGPEGAVYDVEMSELRYDGSQRHSAVASGIGENGSLSVMIAESGGGRWSGAAQGGAIVFIGDGGYGYGGRILAQPADLSLPWVDITGSAYIPLVMINGQGCEEVWQAESRGTIYEGFNLLTPKFRCRFTTNGENGRYYFLPVKQLDNSEITVRYTEPGGLTLTYVIPEGGSASAADPYGNAVFVDRVGGYLYCFQPSTGIIRWFPACGISNNLEVIASKTRAEGADKICSMRVCAWFGGDRSGSFGGSRLFVAGHRLFPNMVHWSDVDNPLYFPENNFAYIGDAGQFVTAFAKQGEKLIIFKESEMYYAEYVSGTRVSKYLPDGSVIDATANEAGFPVAQLHPSVGCDCPNTIRLCGDRLFWAAGGGRVYSLAPAGRYSRNSVTEVSGGIRQKLSGIGGGALKSAVAGDYCGHYALMAGGNMFLLNYGRMDGRADAFPWVCWEFDIGAKPVFMMSGGEGMVINGETETGGACGLINAVLADGCDYALMLDEGQLSVRQTQVEYMLKTGLYDFGAPERYKDVRMMYLELAGESDVPAFLDYFDERGNRGLPIPLSPPDGGLARVPLNAARVRAFGFCVRGSGCVWLHGAVIYYRLYGKAVR